MKSTGLAEEGAGILLPAAEDGTLSPGDSWVDLS